MLRKNGKLAASPAKKALFKIAKFRDLIFHSLTLPLLTVSVDEVDP